MANSNLSYTTKAKAKIILIGGTSHCGKSTIAQNLSKKLKIDIVATDGLAKHPGRPWKEDPNHIPDHVKHYYFELSTEEMMTSVLAHYKNIWPIIQSKIEQSIIQNSNLIIEGSALLPKFIHKHDNVVLVWLTASNEDLKTRIYKSSQYHLKSLGEKKLIDNFIKRTIAFDNFLKKDLEASGYDHTLFNTSRNKKIEEELLALINIQ